MGQVLCWRSKPIIDCADSKALFFFLQGRKFWWVFIKLLVVNDKETNFILDNTSCMLAFVFRRQLKIK